MRLFTFSGPPASGKTAVITKLIEHFKNMDLKVGVVKFDCLQTEDDKIYKALDVAVIKGLSGELCPDHYFISNIEDVYKYGVRKELDILISESAGLCNRCAPHVKGIPAVCVLDQMSGIQAPKKIGPMLRLADFVIITKSDMVSQAEREVFMMNVKMINPRAKIWHINGLSGQGSYQAAQSLIKLPYEDIFGKSLRFPMPMALCSYCLGETRIGEEFQKGNRKKIVIED